MSRPVVTTVLSTTPSQTPWKRYSALNPFGGLTVSQAPDSPSPAVALPATLATKGIPTLAALTALAPALTGLPIGAAAVPAKGWTAPAKGTPGAKALPAKGINRAAPTAPVVQQIAYVPPGFPAQLAAGAPLPSLGAPAASGLAGGVPGVAAAPVAPVTMPGASIPPPMPPFPTFPQPQSGAGPIPFGGKGAPVLPWAAPPGGTGIGAGVPGAVVSPPLSPEFLVGALLEPSLAQELGQFAAARFGPAAATWTQQIDLLRLVALRALGDMLRAPVLVGRLTAGPADPFWRQTFLAAARQALLSPDVAAVFAQRFGPWSGYVTDPAQRP